MSKNRDKEYPKEEANRLKDFDAKAKARQLNEGWTEHTTDKIVDDKKYDDLKLVFDEHEKIIDEQLKILKEQGESIKAFVSTNEKLLEEKTETDKIIKQLEIDYNNLAGENTSLKIKNTKLKKALKELSTE